MSIALIGLPLFCGLFGLLMPQRNRHDAAALGVVGALGTLAISVWLLVRKDVGEISTHWVSFGELDVTIGTLTDTRALLMALAVAIVALCVQLYSVAYLSDDDRYGPYAAQVSIFTAAMLTVVLSGDLIMLLVGWEVMGACSYLLIAHDRKLPEAPAAAVKAFLVTRLGDVGFLLGILILGLNAGTFRISEVLAHPLSGAKATLVALLLLAGVAGKSAQFPLHTWLPDAMAGPTPISALIHAATMVAAGVYVVAKLFPIFSASSIAMTVLGIMAAITLLLGALAATAADDVKRVLAWSTVSQLGYMMAALAMSALTAAMFHLLAHAAFKALLFLCAGSLIHATGSNLMSRMGGLRREMPLTFWTMTIGLGALAGIPPMAGFFSKEAVVASLHEQRWLWICALTGVAVTAWYSTRVWLLVFFGPSKQHGHEPAWQMSLPLVALAIPAAGLGVGVYLSKEEIAHVDATVVLPLVLTGIGILLAWIGWRTGGDPARILGPSKTWVAGGFGLDAVQRVLIVQPVLALARFAKFIDVSGVDGAVMGVGRAVSGGGGLLARWHQTALPRALGGVLVGAVLLAAITAGWWGAQ